MIKDSLREKIINFLLTNRFVRGSRVFYHKIFSAIIFRFWLAATLVMIFLVLVVGQTIKEIP